MNPKVLGLVNCYNEPGFGPMTKHRNIASASFLGRYAFIDFALSNFTNSGIEDIGVLCQNHIRSLSRHVQSGRSWNANTKVGSFVVLYDEPNVRIPAYNTDVANLTENEWYLKQVKPDYVVLAPAHILYLADFRKLLQDHIASGARITMLYTQAKNLRESFIGSKKIFVTDRGKVSKIEINKGDSDEGNISLETLIMDATMLQNLLEYARGTSSFFGIMDTLAYLSPSVLVRAVPMSGYIRCYDSLSHYLRYSLELLDENLASTLFHPDWPIYTKTYDTPPVSYRKGGKVSNSFIANGCNIEGTVENAILGRNVKVRKGAVVRNAVIGSDSVIDKDTHIENAVVDKEAQVVHISEVVGTLDDPLYIARGDIV